MKQGLLPLVLIGIIALGVTRGGSEAAKSNGFNTGTPELVSMSALTFNPEGVLFVGDGKGGAVFAIDLDDRTARDDGEALSVHDVEGKIADFLGTTAADILIHDMAVNPISQNVYLSVSRGRGRWDSSWLLPNDLADGNLLLRITPSGDMEVVELASVRYARAALPNPVAPDKMHRWKEGIPLRADTVTDLAFADGILYVAGLSNEEFASTMWRFKYPFENDATATTLEIFHGAHGEFETHAPIRTFVPYTLSGEAHLLAAYLCTPLVTFRTSDLVDGQHVKGRTVAEFGSGNYPLDMIVYRKNGRERLLIANSNLPFMIVDPQDIEAFDGEITEEVESYVAGVSYEPRSGTGIQQLDNLNGEYVLALKRLPGGTMDLVSLPVRRF